MHHPKQLQNCCVYHPTDASALLFACAPPFASTVATSAAQVTPPRQIVYPQRNQTEIATLTAAAAAHASSSSPTSSAFYTARPSKRAKVESLSFRIALKDPALYSMPRTIAPANMHQHYHHRSSLSWDSSSSSEMEDPVVAYKVHYHPQPAMRRLAERSRQLVREPSLVDMAQQESYRFPAFATKPRSSSVASSSSTASTSSQPPNSGKLSQITFRRRQAKLTSSSSSHDGLDQQPLRPSASCTNVANRTSDSLCQRRGKFVPSLSLRPLRQKRKQQV